MSTFVSNFPAIEADPHTWIGALEMKGVFALFIGRLAQKPNRILYKEIIGLRGDNLSVDDAKAIANA